MRILESDRLLIKPVEKEDLLTLLNLRWDSNIEESIIHEPISMESQQAWFESTSKSNNLACTIFLKNTDDPKNLKIIGTIGLFNFNHRHQRATWRMRISPESQGKGIAFEAATMVLGYGFNTLNLHKIIGDSLAENVAISKLTEKFGFVKEGEMKSHYFHQGCFKDGVAWGLIREDFNKKFNSK